MPEDRNGSALPRRAEAVVVGAGLAGLECARRVAATGVDVLLLEALGRAVPPRQPIGAGRGR